MPVTIHTCTLDNGAPITRSSETRTYGAVILAYPPDNLHPTVLGWARDAEALHAIINASALANDAGSWG